MDNTISKNLNSSQLLRFAFPTIIMMVVMSLYTTVDAAFVSKLVSEDALAAINIVYPLYGVFLAIGMMMSTGSNAYIAKTLGEGNYDKARSFFSLIYLVGVSLGTVLGVFGFFFYKPLLVMLGSTPSLDLYTTDYLRYLVIFTPICFLQIFAQAFFITEGKPQLGLGLIVLGGLANVVFDYVFIALLDMGIAGAAFATGIGYCIPGLFGLIYFILNKNGTLYFIKPRWSGKELLLSLINGSSEFVNNISMAITTLLFNYAMLKYIGKSGVAAISAILYLQFIQGSVYFGFSSGVAPIISFKYGENNRPQLKRTVKTGMTFTAVCSLGVFLLSLVLADQAVSVFVRQSSDTFGITKQGFLIFNFSYLFMGLNVFVSAMFTALGNGKVSALLSLLRTLVFIVGSLLLLPLIWEVDGVWLAVPAAEALAFIVSIRFFVKLRKKYGY